MRSHGNRRTRRRAARHTRNEKVLRAMTDQVADRCELLKEDPATLVAARLRRSGYPFLRGITCDVREGVACLSGTVPTFHLKQIAQELASHTPGVWQVDNRLHVPRSTYRPRHVAK
jgi:hypothetical protein